MGEALKHGLPVLLAAGGGKGANGCAGITCVCVCVRLRVSCERDRGWVKRLNMACLSCWQLVGARS